MLQRALLLGTLCTVGSLIGCSSSSDSDDMNTAGTDAGGSSGEGTSGGTGGTASGGDGTGGTINGGSGGSPQDGGAGGTSGGTANGGNDTGGTGSGGDAGSGGTNEGGSGGSTGGMSNFGPSPGCNATPPDDPIRDPVQHDLEVNVADLYKPTYVNRKYYTQLPENWDPSTPYPVIFYGQGCGQTGPENGPFSNGHFATDVLYVQLIPASVTGDTVVPQGGSPGCFQAGRRGLADSPDGPYFDQALAEIAQKYCIDMGKIYMAGWSSGAWLTNYLACTRGNVIAGAASGSGGLQFDHPECVGGTKIVILPGDAGQTQEQGNEIGAQLARDLLITANGCATTSMDVTLGNTDCQVYDGCTMGGVAWCPGPGGHGGPLNSIADSAWQFWTGQ